MATPRRLALLALCRSLPGVTEEVKWTGDLVFCVGNKMFATFDAKGQTAEFGCRVPESDFAAVTAVEGIRPARFGGARLSWIRVADPRALLASEAAALIRASYDVVRLTLSPEQRKEIRGPAARARIPKRLARTRPRVESPAEKRAAASRPAAKAAGKPGVPSAPKAAKRPSGAKAPLPLRVPVASKAPEKKALAAEKKPASKVPAKESKR